MKKCPHCNSIIFNIDSEGEVNYVSCIGCQNIIGTFNSNNEVKSMIEEHHSGMVDGLNKLYKNQMAILTNQHSIINNQGIIINKIK